MTKIKDITSYGIDYQEGFDYKFDIEGTEDIISIPNYSIKGYSDTKIMMDVLNLAVAQAQDSDEDFYITIICDPDKERAGMSTTLNKLKPKNFTPTYIEQ